MPQKRVVGWLVAAVVLTAAVVALREVQPPIDSGPTEPMPPRPTEVRRFAAQGVLLPAMGEPPGPVTAVQVWRTGPDRLRVAWSDAVPRAVPGSAVPANAVGYHVRWRSVSGADHGERLVVVPEIELDGLRDDGDYTLQVRAVDAFGRRSVATERSTASAPAVSTAWNERLLTGFADDFDGPFSVDAADTGARWHLTGYSGCTRAGTEHGVLTVELDCGGDHAVLRARSPVRLAPSGQRGRIVLVTDGGGPRGSLTVDLVPGPADRVGAGRSAIPPAGTPPNGVAVEDAALPDGTLRVLIDDAGVRVLTGPGVPRLPAAPVVARAAPVRGVGVLHEFEVVLDDAGVQVLQDGVLVAAAGVTVPWTEAYLLLGLGGPPGQSAEVRLDAVGFAGQPVDAPASYAHPVIPATQRLLGLGEVAPGIGISRERLAGAASARLVTTVRTSPRVDLSGLQLQQGDAITPARPVLPSVPTAPGSDVTVTADLLPHLLGPTGPPAISPLVLRAPGAESVVVPIVSSYLEIVPLPGHDVPDTTPAPHPGGRRAPALPGPSVAVLDSEAQEVSAVASGSRVIVDVVLDGLGGQLSGTRLAGVAGFQLWLDGRLIAGVPTAADGPGLGGTYRIALSTRALQPGRQSLELRVVAADAAMDQASVLTSWRLL